MSKNHRPWQKGNIETQRHERTLRAVELRRAGKSYRIIAQTLGVDVRTAWEDVWRYFGELKKQTVEELEFSRARDLAMVDRWLEALEPKCEKGDAKAILAAEKLLARRAKLQGTEAPIKRQNVPAEPSVNDDELLEQLTEAIEVVRARVAERQKGQMQ